MAAAALVAACGNTSPTPTAVAGQASPADVSASLAPNASADTSTTPSSSAASSSSGGSSGVGSTVASASASVSAKLLPMRLPSPLSRFVVGVIGGQVLVLGGVSTGGTTDAILRLDPAAGSTQRVGQMATAVHDASGAALGTGWLVLGGGRTVAITAVQDATVTGSGVSAPMVGSLPAPRADGAAATVNGAVIVAGGGRGGVPDPTILETRDGVGFSTLGRLRVAVRYPAAVVAAGVLYLFGGQTTNGLTDVIQAVNPATGAVRVVGHLPYALAQATGFTLGGRIVLAGGMRGSQASAAILAFDPASGRTAVVGHLPESVASAGVAVVGDTAYLIGGETANTFLDTVIAIK